MVLLPWPLPWSLLLLLPLPVRPLPLLLQPPLLPLLALYDRAEQCMSARVSWLRLSPNKAVVVSSMLSTLETDQKHNFLGLKS